MAASRHLEFYQKTNLPPKVHPVGGYLPDRQQGSRIRSVRILFSERYVRTLTYSILAYVNKNRIRTQTMTAKTANWFFATFIINLLSESVLQNSQFD